jgi:uncharacterized protein (TIGR03067 family)
LNSEVNAADADTHNAPLIYQLQGLWRAKVWLLNNESEIDDSLSSNIAIRFDENRMTQLSTVRDLEGEQTSKVLTWGEFSIDPHKNPAWITVVNPDLPSGKAEGIVQIYADELRIAFRIDEHGVLTAVRPMQLSPGEAVLYIECVRDALLETTRPRR